MPDDLVEVAWNVLEAVYPTLPVRESLGRYLRDAEAAQERGYFLPDEDERLREVYIRYLASRSALLEMLTQIKPGWRSGDPCLFAIAYCAASALVRSAGYLVEVAGNRPVVHKKLDEADPRYQLPRKTFTSIYRNFTSPRTNWEFSRGRSFYEKNRDLIHEALEGRGLPKLIDFLQGEAPFTHRRKRTLWNLFVNYRWHSLSRRTRSGYTKTMFHLFRVSGCAISKRRDPFAGPKKSGKRVTNPVVNEVRCQLKPGDIIITRHDDALSNLFIPGHWPHAAFFVGSPEQRRLLNLRDDGAENEDVLEAKKDGVKLRTLEETLTVDAFLILRPTPGSADLAPVIDRALEHRGKLYDFLFDFRKSERLACTEVVYRSFHGIGRWHLELIKKGGRLTLPAEDLIRQMVAKNLAEVFGIYGSPENRWVTGPEARELLEKTFPLAE